MRREFKPNSTPLFDQVVVQQMDALKQTIERMMDSLKRYAARENASEAAISAQNQNIQALVEVYNWMQDVFVYENETGLVGVLRHLKDLQRNLHELAGEAIYFQNCYLTLKNTGKNPKEEDPKLYNPKYLIKMQLDSLIADATAENKRLKALNNEVRANPEKTENGKESPAK